MGFHLEKDIEDYLYRHPRDVRNWGYTVQKWIAKQYRVPSGVIDLLGFAKANYTEEEIFNPLVLEVKNDSIKSKDLAQVCRYAYDIDQIMMTRDFSYEQGNTQKMLIGIGCPDDRVLYEADSMNISIISISCNPVPIVSGSWRWKDERRKDVSDALRRAAFSNLFDVFGGNDTLDMENYFDKKHQQEAEEAG